MANWRNCNRLQDYHSSALTAKLHHLLLCLLKFTTSWALTLRLQTKRTVIQWKEDFHQYAWFYVLITMDASVMKDISKLLSAFILPLSILLTGKTFWWWQCRYPGWVRCSPWKRQQSQEITNNRRARHFSCWWEQHSPFERYKVCVMSFLSNVCTYFIFPPKISCLQDMFYSTQF